MAGLSSNETFLTLDVGTERTSALWFSVTADRTLVIEKSEDSIDLAVFLNSPLRRMAQASWEGKYFFDGHRKVVAAADSRLATTMPVPLSWRRDAERRHLPLSLDELDDHLGRVMSKITTECRAEAAGRFGIDPIDTVLVAARAYDVAVDGRKAPRGEGVIGGEVSFILELTFAVRALFDRFHAFFKSPESFFFAESPQVRLDVLRRVRPLPLNLVAGGTSSLFVLQAAKEKYPVLYREPFPWPFEAMFDRISAAFSVSRAVAEDMVRMYAAGIVSLPVARTLSEFMAPSAESFMKALRKAKVHGSVFVDAPYPVPITMPYKEGKMTIEEIQIGEILARFDLVLKPGQPESAAHNAIEGRPAMLWRHLAPFLAMYFDRTQGALNDRLRKRVHWLAK